MTNPFICAPYVGSNGRRGLGFKHGGAGGRAARIDRGRRGRRGGRGGREGSGAEQGPVVVVDEGRPHVSA